MRIDGQNPNITIGKTPGLSPLSELNLQDGQKVIGRIISLSAGEALLDLAGRVLTAKIEGNPPFMTPGAVLSFKVNADTEGKIQLKVLNPVIGQTAPGTATPVPSESVPPCGGSPVSTPNNGVDARAHEIINALLKNNLPALPENITKIARTVQNFQIKYRLPLNPETAAFVMAQKWPMTDGVLLTALLLQDRNLRNQLWNALHQMSVEFPEIAQTLADFKLNMEEDATPIIAKLKMLNVPDNQGEISADPEILPSLTPGKETIPPMGTLKSGQVYVKQNDTLPGFQSAETDVSNEVNPTGGNLSDVLIRTINHVKDTDSNPSLVFEQSTPEKNAAPEAAPQKILALLEQNLDLQKALHEPPNGLYTVIPLLIRDARDNLHECFVEWRSEPRKRGNNLGEQHLSFVIPTDNMGMIRMSVGIGARTTIALKVGSPEVREFLSRQTDSLRECVSAPVAVSVGLDEEKTAESQFNGVDMRL